MQDRPTPALVQRFSPGTNNERNGFGRFFPLFPKNRPERCSCSISRAWGTGRSPTKWAFQWGRWARGFSEQDRQLQQPWRTTIVLGIEVHREN